MSSTERGRTTCPALCSTLAGRLLEGAASKAHLSPMHGTRAALELHPGSRMADTEKRCENSHSAGSWRRSATVTPSYRHGRAVPQPAVKGTAV